MPRAVNGVYTLPAGNPVVTGTTITSTWGNTTMSDVATALTDSLSRSGDGAMLAPLQLTDGTAGAPSLTFGTDTDTGLYRVAANTLGITSAGTLRGSVNGTGNWTLAAPTAGTVVTINSLAAEAGINVAAASGSNATIELTGTGGGYGWGLRSLNGGTFDIRNSTLAKTAILFSADAEPVVSINDYGTMREAATKLLVPITLTASTTFSNTHAGRMILSQMAAGAQTLTGYAAPEGTVITITGNVNAVNIAAGSGTLYWFTGATITSGARVLAVGGVCTMYRTGSDWYMWGTGIS